VSTFLRLRQEAMAMDNTFRLEQFTSILAATKSDERNYHDVDFNLQQLFDTLIRDRRFTEGRKIKRLLEALPEAQGNFVPENILELREIRFGND